MHLYTQFFLRFHALGLDIFIAGCLFFYLVFLRCYGLDSVLTFTRSGCWYGLDFFAFTNRHKCPHMAFVTFFRLLPQPLPQAARHGAHRGQHGGLLFRAALIWQECVQRSCSHAVVCLLASETPHRSPPQSIFHNNFSVGSSQKRSMDI